MALDKNVKILLVPDVIWGDDSGAVSARFTASQLNICGYSVAVYASPCRKSDRAGVKEAGFAFFHRSQYSFVNHFYGGKTQAEFEDVLSCYKPDYVFFLGAALNKPYCFFKACLKQYVPYSLLFYINDYYCMHIYAGLRNGPCFKCVKGDYLNALVNGCQRGRPRLFQFIKSAVVLNRLKSVLLKCHGVVGYSDNQLDIYKQYGFLPEKCVKTPIHFDKGCLLNANPKCGDYFVLAGQSTVEKGWHKLAEIVQLCPGVKFKAISASLEVAEAGIDRFGLRKFVDNGQIEIVTGVTDHSDFISILGGARGVLIPSYYPTTGEFFLLESLGLGKPVVVFNAGIHGDVIRSGENGFMVEIGDVRGYANCINSLAASESLYRKVSEGARRLFEKLTSSADFYSAIKVAFPPRENGGGL